ncbi:MAG: glycosyltransferase family 2 protein [Candidatus Nanohaloarchaea archaeon]
MLEILIMLIYVVILYNAFFILTVLLELDTVQEEVEWRDEWPSLTVIVPAYNEEDCIEKTIESLLDADYPRLEIVAVNDGSTDGTPEVLEKYREQDCFRLINQENQGKGAALNRGLEELDTELFAVLDADSRVKKDSLKNIVSEMSDDSAAIACAMLVDSPSNLLQRLQQIEYVVGIFLRKVMWPLDSIHITPGPMSVYRTEKIREIGGFDEESLVEDQEICWRLQEKHEKIEHSRHGRSYTEAPETLREFYNQRTRWWAGSFQCLIDNREKLLNPRYGDFGMFVAPIKAIQAFLSIIGLFLMIYFTLEPILAFLNDFARIGWSAFKFGFSFSVEGVFNAAFWTVFTNNLVLLSLLGTLFLQSSALVYLAAVHADQNLREIGVLPTAIYVFWFFAISGFLSLVSIIKVARRREIEW